MTRHSSDFQLVGETVTVSYSVDPTVGHGQFRLENHGTVAIVAAVASAWLDRGAHRQPLSGITVYDLDHEQMVNAERLEVDAGTAMRFLIGFPVLAYEPPFGESTAVGLRLSVDGADLQALSPVEFVRRHPRENVRSSPQIPPGQ